MGIGYRYFGFLNAGEGDGIRFTWLEVVQKWGLGVRLSNRGIDHDGDPWWLHVMLIFFAFHLRLPLPPRPAADQDGFGDSWGFVWYWDRDENGAAVHLNWGKHCKIVHLPWHWEWVRTSYLMPDGETWEHETEANRRAFVKLGRKNHEWWATWRDRPRWTETHDYLYVLKNGTRQERRATVKVEEREWRWRWLMWSRWPRLIRRTIAVEFNDEVGERSGSWKGGTIGCSYDLRPGETPLQCLRRMERERKFR